MLQYHLKCLITPSTDTGSVYTEHMLMSMFSSIWLAKKTNWIPTLITTAFPPKLAFFNLCFFYYSFLSKCIGGYLPAIVFLPSLQL